MVKAAPELEAAVLFEVPLEKGSEQEVALRASASTAVEQIGFFSWLCKIQWRPGECAERTEIVQLAVGWPRQARSESQFPASPDPNNKLLLTLLIAKDTYFRPYLLEMLQIMNGTGRHFCAPIKEKLEGNAHNWKAAPKSLEIPLNF